MADPERIIIPKGMAINGNNAESDEDPLIALEPIEAFTVGPKKDGGIPVRIPALDPDRTYFIHFPD